MLSYNYNNGRFEKRDEKSDVHKWDNSNWLVKDYQQTIEIESNTYFDNETNEEPF